MDRRTPIRIFKSQNVRVPEGGSPLSDKERFRPPSILASSEVLPFRKNRKARFYFWEVGTKKDPRRFSGGPVILRAVLNYERLSTSIAPSLPTWSPTIASRDQP